MATHYFFYIFFSFRLGILNFEYAFDKCKAGWKTKANAGARSTNSHVVVTRKNGRFTILHKFLVPTHIPILNYVDGVNFQTYLARSKINKNKNGFGSKKLNPIS